MKKILVKVVFLVVMLLIGALVVVFLTLNSLVKKGVETVGPQVTKVSIKLDSVNLSVFSGKGTLKGLVVGNPEGYQTESAVHLGEATLQLDPKSLLADKVVVKSIHVVAPEITFEGSLKGNNLTKLQSNVEEFTARLPKGSDKGGGSGAGKKLQVDDFSITGGKVNLSMTVLGGQKMSVPLPDIHLQGLGTGPEGITVGELIKQVLAEVVSKTTKEVTGALGKLGGAAADAAKEAGQSASEGAKKTAEGIKSLFKRK